MTVPATPEDDELRLAKLAEKYDTSQTLDPDEASELETAAPQIAACLRELHRCWNGDATATGPENTNGSQEPDHDVENFMRVGRFELRERLGAGGFGVVFRAFDPLLRRDVALKIPHVTSLFDRRLRIRFLREGEAVAALEHPHIVPVYEAGEASGVPYIASAYCGGTNLAEWMATRTQPAEPHTAAGIVRDLARAVQHAHAHQIVHRDIKPANVLLVPAAESSIEQTDAAACETPRLTDFGLAKLIDKAMNETGSSTLMGTPQYMAPEQIAGGATEDDTAADLWSLGVILYELLARQPPFQGQSFVDVLDQIRTESPAALRRFSRRIPRTLETICLKCLQKRPADRYRSATELADDLGRFLSGEPIQALPLRWRDRFAAWSRRPQRIVQAGILAFVISGIMLVWIILFGMFSSRVGAVSFPEAYQNESVSDGLVILVTATLPTMFLAWHTMHRKRWAIWAGAALIGFGLSQAVGLLLGWVPSPFASLYDGYPLRRYLVYSLLLLLDTVQLAAYLLALRADLAGGSQKGSSMV